MSECQSAVAMLCCVQLVGGVTSLTASTLLYLPPPRQLPPTLPLNIWIPPAELGGEDQRCKLHLAVLVNRHNNVFAKSCLHLYKFTIKAIPRVSVIWEFCWILIKIIWFSAAVKCCKMHNNVFCYSLYQISLYSLLKIQFISWFLFQCCASF